MERGSTTGGGRADDADPTGRINGDGSRQPSVEQQPATPWLTSFEAEGERVEVSVEAVTAIRDGYLPGLVRRRRITAIAAAVATVAVPGRAQGGVHRRLESAFTRCFVHLVFDLAGFGF